MMRFLRKHRNWLMIVISILAIPFVFYFVQKPDYARMHGDEVWKIYGRSVSQVEAQKYARLYGLARSLGMSRFVQDLTAGARDDNERTVEFILNLIILRHEAESLGIRPTPNEVVDFVRNLRAFKGPSGFDLNKYNEFTEQMLSPNGFSEANVEDLARDEISLNRIKEIVSMTVSVPETETKSNYEEAYGKLTVSVVRLRSADFAKDIKITDDDIKKFFESHKVELKTEEKRKVEFITISLNDAEKKLTGKERIDALQKLSDRTTDVTAAFAEKGADFQKVAAKFQLPIQTTEEFTVTKPDPKLGTEGQLAAASFQLTQEEPNSEPIQVADGYYILHLAGIVPARPLTLDEAKPRIVDSLKASRSREAMTTKGAQATHDLREGLKAGEPLAFALEKVNVKAEKVPPFTLLEDESDEPDVPEKPKQPDKKAEKPKDFLTIKNAVGSLQPGDVSELFPSEDGGIIVILEKREPPDEAKYGQKKATLAERVKRNKQQIVFYEWLHERQRAAGIAGAKS